MKRTRNMVYKPSDEATELFLYATNTGHIWNLRNDILANLRRHYKKGRYDKDKAVDAWYHFMTLASKEYWKDFGYGFSVTARFTAAIYMEEDTRTYMLDD